MLDLLQTIFALEETAHWYPLIWLFAAGILLYKMPKQQVLVCGQVQERWYSFTAILLVLPLILWAGLRGYIGDTYAYIASFRKAPSSLSALLPGLNADTKDPGFTVLITLIKMLGVSDYRVFFLVIAALQMLCIAYTFRKYSSNYWVSIFLFVASTDYLSWMFNGMRQFIATVMIFAAFDLMVKRRHVAFALVVLLASQIHGSAILMLPLAYVMHGPALNNKTLLMIVGTVLIIPFIDRFTPILNDLLSDTQYSTTMTDEIWSADDGTNPIRVLVYAVPAMIALFGRRYVVQSNDPVINLCVNASMITTALYLVSMVTSGIYVGRLPIYTTLHGYIALPWLIETIFEKSSARLINLMMVAFFVLFFYYQMHIAWGYF